MRRRDVLKAAALGGAALTGMFSSPKKSFAKNPEFSFRLQSFLGPGWKEWEVLVPRFCKMVNLMSGGRIEIKPYPPGALVATFDLIDGVGKRVVEIGYGAQAYWRGVFPYTIWAWGVPFALDVVEHYDYLWYEAGLLNISREQFATKNIHFLGPVYSDEWGETISTKPIRTLSDFKGLKIRSFGVVADIWKHFGAAIVRLPGEELYTGLATGVIDGVNWGSPYGNVATKLHEVAKFYCGPSLISFDAEDLFMNMDAYKALPSELQECMNVASRIFALQRATISTYESATAVGLMKKAGVKFSTLPDSDLAQMRKLSDEIIQDQAKADPVSQKVIKMIMDLSKTISERPRMFRAKE